MKPTTFLILAAAVMMPGPLLAQTAELPAAAPTVLALPAVAPAPGAALLPTPAAHPIPAAARAPQAPAAPKAAPAPAAALAPAPPAPPRALGQMVNVQIEVTLTDSKGSPKSVVLTVADGELGQNRTVSYYGEARSSSYSFNADGRPVVSGNKIRLYLSAEATVPPVLDANGKTVGTSQQISLRQSQTLIMNDGDTMEIARAADPVTDRVFALTVRVKIQR